MSRSLTGSTDSVNLGSDASLDDMSTGTMMSWVRVSALPGAGSFLQIAEKGALFHYFDGDTGRLGFEKLRATSGLVAIAAFSSFPALRALEWAFIVARWNTGGANADQQILVGNLQRPPAEPSSYTSQSVGSGAFTSDASSSLFFGNASFNGAALNGLAHLVAISRLYLSAKDYLLLWDRSRNGLRFEVPGLVAHVPIGRGHGGARDIDLTMRGNNGVITGCRLDRPMTAAHDGFRALRRRSYAAPQILTGCTVTGTFAAIAGTIALADVTLTGLLASGTLATVNGTIALAQVTLTGLVVGGTATPVAGSIALADVTLTGLLAAGTLTPVAGTITLAECILSGGVAGCTATPVIGTISSGGIVLSGLVASASASPVSGSIELAAVVISNLVNAMVATPTIGSVALGDVTLTGLLAGGTLTSVMGSIAIAQLTLVGAIASVNCSAVAGSVVYATPAPPLGRAHLAPGPRARLLPPPRAVAHRGPRAR